MPASRWLRSLETPPIEAIVLGQSVGITRDAAIAFVRRRKMEISRICRGVPSFALWVPDDRRVCRVRNDEVDTFPTTTMAALALGVSRWLVRYYLDGVADPAGFSWFHGSTAIVVK